MSDNEDKLGSGWGWWIIFLTLCVMDSCEKGSDNKEEIEALRSKVERLESEAKQR